MKFLGSLQSHRCAGKAMLAANFYNVETLMAVLEAARRVGVEVILQTSPATLRYLGGAKLAAAMARAAADQANVTAWLHLDHATDPAMIRACIDAGYDSVMIDASEQPFAANVEITRPVVQQAHARGVAVEAELGYIPKLGQRDASEAGYTSPDDAAQFVKQTNVDLLAVAIGTAHGFYKKQPRLDLDRLAAIRRAVNTPLVLHGGSGLSPQQWRDCIARGIVKINFATEIKDAFMSELRRAMTQSDQIDLRKVFPPASTAVVQLVSEKLRICAGA
jgi:fructose-bisphosphate aldolase class II/tagatose 1,6-diphosphate aldolase GatY/KbaY